LGGSVHLDQFSYVASLDQLADTPLFLSSIFVDGDVHRRFGTRSFILALQNGHYVEVESPLAE